MAITGISNSNYKVTLSSKSWIIHPKVATVEWVENSPYIYDKTYKTVGAVVTNLEQGDTANVIIVNEGSEDGRLLRYTAINCGLYRAVISSVSNANYTIAGAQNLVLDWEIDKADITNITLSDKTVTYNGQVHSLQVSATYTQYGDAAIVNYSISPQGASSNGALHAGSYTVTATVNAGDNYNQLTLQATLTIKQSPNKSQLGGLRQRPSLGQRQ